MSTQALRRRGPDPDQPSRYKPLAKRRQGRPPAFREEVLPGVIAMAHAGLTDAEMAHALGWSISTFYLTMNNQPEFSEAVRKGKAVLDDHIENAMARRAKGYDIKVEKVFANGHRAEVTEHIPADPGAAMNWLVNRRGWRKNLEIVVPPPMDEEPKDVNEPTNRQLALAALALMSEAAYEAPTIEAEAEELDDGQVDEAQHDETSAGGARRRRSRRAAQAPQADAPDDDFDF